MFHKFTPSFIEATGELTATGQLVNIKSESVEVAQCQNGCELHLSCKHHEEQAATEMLLELHNRTAESVHFEAPLAPFALSYKLKEGSIPVVHYSGGGRTDAVFPGSSFVVHRAELPDWSSLTFGSDRGRCSSVHLPFFHVSTLNACDGLTFGLGYSGSWQVEILRDIDPRSMAISFRLPIALTLPPGESVFVASLLCQTYEGGLDAAGNGLRKVIRDKIAPTLPSDSGLPAPRYVHWFGIQHQFDEALLLEQADCCNQLGLEYFEVDAAWAKQGTHRHYGAGNWERTDIVKFPHGLPAFAEAIRKKNLKFGLWIEPESIEAGTVAEERLAESILRLPGGKRHLADFSKETTIRYYTDLIDRIFKENGVKWSRIDSNLDPLPFWQCKPDPGLRGYTELKHFEGYYRFIDEIRKRHPELHVEHCSSGGLRINLELIRRGHSFWISDNTVFASTVHQHIGGANRFLPTHFIGAELTHDYSYRELQPYKDRGPDFFPDYQLAGFFGCLMGFGDRFAAYPQETVKRLSGLVDLYKELRENLMGDFYALLPAPRSLLDNDAWQFHLPNRQKGHVIAFRNRSDNPEITLRFRGLEGSSKYQIESVFPHCKDLGSYSGKELALGYTTKLQQIHSSEIIQYTIIE